MLKVKNRPSAVLNAQWSLAKREKMLRCHLQWNRRWPRHHSWAMLSSRPTQKLFILHYAVSVDVNATVRECRAAGTWPWHTMIWFLFTQPDAAMGQHFINEEMIWNDLKWPKDELSKKRRWWNGDHMMIHAVLWPYEVCKLLIICCWTCLANWLSITPLWQVWMYHGGI